jgi:hypothetical protein
MRAKIIDPAFGARSKAAHLDELLDEALEETFPASDPIAISFEEREVSREVCVVPVQPKVS